MDELIRLARKEYEATSDATWAVAADAAAGEVERLRRELQEYKDALELEQRYATNVAIRRAFDPELDR